MIRDPRRVLVSQAAWFSFVWHYFASPLETYPFRDELRIMTRSWYAVSLEELEGWDRGDYRIIEYRRLIDDPVGTINGLYDDFSLEMSPEFATFLRRESQRTDEYASARAIGIREVGYEEAEIEREFAPIFDRFAFPKSEAEE